jgi:hypothetical protein
MCASSDSVLRSILNSNQFRPEFACKKTQIRFFKIDRGVNPGSFDLDYFLIFQHFTAEPQRLP